MTLSAEVEERWHRDRPAFEQLKGVVQERLEDIVRHESVPARVSVRVKDLASMQKKIYNKRHGIGYYDEMTDKLGARVVCRFHRDRPTIVDAIAKRFTVLNRDDKSASLAPDQFGYRSIHLDAEWHEDGVGELMEERGPARVFEIQIRSICEDAWAEIYHDLGYKGNSALDDRTKRSLFTLAGLFEVADRDLDRALIAMERSEPRRHHHVAAILEALFCGRSAEAPNREMTLQVLAALLGEQSDDSLIGQMQDFVRKNSEKIGARMAAVKHRRPNPFLSQPEVLLIVKLLEDDPHQLAERWDRAFPRGDLSDIATWWGSPLD